jgi:multidrug efflux pump subunit AcrB
MNGLISWFARNSVAANLLMIVIVFAGLFTVFSLRKEIFPEIDTDMVSVRMMYRGASPEEVEEAIATRIEERIHDLQGIKRITSTSAEGVGTVMIEVLEGADSRAVLNDVKSRVDAIDNFPQESEQPVISELVLRRQVITVAVSGDADERSLKHLGERVRDDLAAIPGITQVELAAVRPYEVTVELSESQLRRYGLTFDYVANAIRRSSLDLPAGSIRTDAGEVMIRTQGQAYSAADFENLILTTRPDGTRLRLGEVARVVDGFAETDQMARFDGKPAVLVLVFRVGNQDATTVAELVKEYVGTAGSRMPEGISLTTWQDDSLLLKGRLELLLRNGRAGLILVFLVLALFLKLRLAGWVALGIPISFLGAIALLPIFDISINLLSLFAFIIVLGIVVDDAIVVGENIYRHHEEGKEGLTAAIDGAQEVAIPVTFAILTTIAAFSPLLMVTGRMGKFMYVVPVIVIATLVFSLIESLFVLPAHLSRLKHGGEQKPKRAITRGWRRFQDGFSGQLDRFVRHVYTPFLARCLDWRYLTVAIAIAALVLTFSFVAAGFIEFTFMPPVESDNVVALLTMPLGTPSESTAAAVRRIEQSALDLQRELDQGESRTFRHVLTSIGEQPFRVMQSQGHGGVGGSFSAPHLGEVNIELMPSEQREVTSGEVANRWRERVGELPEAVELVFTSSLFSSGEAINIQLTGNNLNELQIAASELKQVLREYPGVFDVADSFRAGKEEMKVDITPEAEAIGLTRADLGRQVRQAFYGEEAQRIQRGRDDVRVMVRYPESERRSLGNLEEMRVRTANGAEIPFSIAGTVHPSRGYASITRVDRRRSVNVTADVDVSRANANEIVASLRQTALPGILDRHPSVRASFEGEQQQQRETLGGLKKGFLFALLMIYVLLAIPFKSYVQPLIVMAAIPFGIVGAFWGHVIMGMGLTVLSFFGVIALMGIVVNDSLVMVDFINRKYRGGMHLDDAIRAAGVVRFRPIMLTSLTTFAGLLPLLMERSVQAQFLIPMGVSLAFGVIFATLITLILVPVCYRILEDAVAGFSRWSGRSEEEVVMGEKSGAGL